MLGFPRNLRTKLATIPVTYRSIPRPSSAFSAGHPPHALKRLIYAKKNSVLNQILLNIHLFEYLLIVHLFEQSDIDIDNIKKFSQIK